MSPTEGRWRTRSRGAVVVLFGLLLGCDAHIRAFGWIRTPDGSPLPEATVRVVSWNERPGTVLPDGAFSANVVHGGEVRFRSEAPGFRPVEVTRRGTGRDVCDVVLQPLDAPESARSTVRCKRER
jgi:hypothetical protein